MCEAAAGGGEVCFSSSELCNGPQFCDNGVDEGIGSGLDCEWREGGREGDGERKLSRDLGVFIYHVQCSTGGAGVFDCGNGNSVVLDVLCDGTLNCPNVGPGNDETDILCASKTQNGCIDHNPLKI